MEANATAALSTPAPRANASIRQVARMSTDDGWTFSHWLRAVAAPAGTPALGTLLRAEEARLINVWDLRVVGWNRA